MRRAPAASRPPRGSLPRLRPPPRAPPPRLRSSRGRYDPQGAQDTRDAVREWDPAGKVLPHLESPDESTRLYAAAMLQNLCKDPEHAKKA